MRMTVASTVPHTELVTIWLLAHRIDPCRCNRVVVWSRLRLAWFALYDVDAEGKFFLWSWGGEVAWHWHVRWLRVLPSADWCEPR